MCVFVFLSTCTLGACLCVYSNITTFFEVYAGCRERLAYINWSVELSELAAPVYRATLSTSGPVSFLGSDRHR